MKLSIMWRVRLLNGLLGMGVLIALAVLAQNRIRAVLYSAVERTIREQGIQRARDPFPRRPFGMRPEGGGGMGYGFGGPPPDDSFGPRMGRFHTEPGQRRPGTPSSGFEDSGPMPNPTESAPLPPQPGNPFFRNDRGPRDDHGPPPMRFGAISLLGPRRLSVPQQQENSLAYSTAGFAAVEKGGEDLRQEQWPDGTKIIVFSIGVRDSEGKISSVVQTAATLTETEAAVQEIETAIYAMLPPLAVLAGLLAAFLSDVALAPVGRITNAAAGLEANNLSARLPAPGGNDTFDRLVTVLNALLARLEAAFSRQKRFTADASHELRTPLAVIKAATSLLLENPESLTGLQKVALEGADQAADRANRLVSDLLLLARTETENLPVRRTDVSLERELNRAIRDAETSHAAPHATVSLVLTGNPIAHTDPDHLHRLVVNLVGNALRHTPVDGTITITVDNQPDTFRLTVTDTGEGIAPDALARLGEPFYRPDYSRARSHGGAGLGLALCKGIVAALGGTLTIESVLGEGTSVKVAIS